MPSVTSSNVRYISYDYDLQVLLVQFNNGTIYAYSSVEIEVYGEFLISDSKGKFLNANIKGHYDFVRVS